MSGRVNDSCGLILQAAYEVYAGSGQTANDWNEFVDTLQHTLATIQPPTDETNTQIPLMGNTELPKNGLHGAPSGLISQTRKFESLVDELYLTQGYRNSHHTPSLVQSIATGASLPSQSLTPLRLLSSTCYRSLKDLFQQEDSTLEAIFQQYGESGGVANPKAYEEFLHSLIVLSQRWKRYIFFRQDSITYLAQSRTLFSILEDFLRQKVITYGEYDFIEAMLYNLSAVDGGDEIPVNQFLLAAWANVWEVLQSRDQEAMNRSIREFYDSLLHLIDQQIQLMFERYTHEAANFLQQLQTNHRYRFGEATMKHLRTLIQLHINYEQRKRSKQEQAPLTPKEELLQKQSTLLYAAFAESAASQNVFEFIENLEVIGKSWRKTSPHGALLQCLNYLSVEEHGPKLLNEYEYNSLEFLVYEEDSFILAAWSLYEQSDYSKKGFNEFLENLRVSLDREYRIAMEMLTKDGYKLVNAWSVIPDPRPQLHADAVRDAVLGIQRLPESISREWSMGSGFTESEFILPQELRGTLNAEHSELVRALLAQRDPVLLALLGEFADTRNLSDLLDGFQARIAREQYGSASERHQPQRPSRNRQPKVIQASSPVFRATAAPANNMAEIEAPIDQSLNIYQLSQMLLSLQQDGYLSYETLLLLLRLVQEEQDPVLLAAFDLYKTELEQSAEGMDENAWRELWDTLQRCYQKLVRQNAHAQSVSNPTDFLQPSDTILLSTLGESVLNALSSSERISITNILYLRDLLRQVDPQLFAILALYQAGDIGAEEMEDSLRVLGQRWMKELDTKGQMLVKVLVSLNQAGFLTNSALDYLLGLVYARDSTLASVYSTYVDSASQEALDTDSEEIEEDEDDDDEDDEYYSDEDDEDDEPDSNNDGDEEEDDEDVDDSDERNEHKYSSSSDYDGRSRRGHRRVASVTVPISLNQFMDSLDHIVRSGERTINQLVNEETTQPQAGQYGIWAA